MLALRLVIHHEQRRRRRSGITLMKRNDGDAVKRAGRTFRLKLERRDGCTRPQDLMHFRTQRLRQIGEQEPALRAWMITRSAEADALLAVVSSHGA